MPAGGLVCEAHAAPGRASDVHVQAAVVCAVAWAGLGQDEELVMVLVGVLVFIAVVARMVDLEARDRRGR